MSEKRLKRAGRMFSDFVLLPSVTGACAGLFLFIFKVAANFVIAGTQAAVAAIRHEPWKAFLYLAAAAVFGCIAALILRRSPSSGGAGVPTAVMLLRGQTAFNWITSLSCVFISAMMSFAVGMPLDSEGPGIQLGAAIGGGVTRVCGKKHRALNRYLMTAGCSAGFAIMTNAPIAGIFFALEEAHRRFTPTIIISTATGVLTGWFTAGALGRVFGVDMTFLKLPQMSAFEPRQIWLSLVTGVVAGAAATLIFFIYKKINKLRQYTEKLPFTLCIAAFFVLVAAAGIICEDVTGSGHELISALVSDSVEWYLIPIFFIVRAILTLYADNIGVSGGLTVPLLTFGALAAALCAKAFITVGAMDVSLYTALVVAGVFAFMGAALKTPVTAVIFASEITGGLMNIAFIAVAVVAAYALTELVNVGSINDLVIETKLDAVYENSTFKTYDVTLKVLDGAFVIGKETRDVLWPASCVVLAVRTPQGRREHLINADDTVRVRFSTHDFDATAKELCILLGEQEVPHSEAA